MLLPPKFDAEKNHRFFEIIDFLGKSLDTQPKIIKYPGQEVAYSFQDFGLGCPGSFKKDIRIRENWEGWFDKSGATVNFSL